jgi:hypothetical protein
MAAAAANIQNYLTGTLLIPAEVVNQLVTVHGYDGHDAFKEATETDIRDLISTIRKTPVPPSAGQPVDPNAPKIVVGQQFAIRIQAYAYLCRYLHIVDRAYTPGNQTLVHVTRIGRHFRQFDEDHTDTKLPAHPAAFDNKNSRTMLEDIDSWLGKAYGHENILLSYITREFSDPADNPMPDPGLFRPTIDMELVRRARHDDDVFVENNKKVWQMIRAVTHKTDAWSVVKTFARTENGRGAYFALVGQYKGRGHVNRIKTEARSVLDKLFWNGKSRNFSWDTFTSRLQGAFDDLAEFGDFRTDEHRVTCLLEKVEKDSGLTAACTFIRNDPRYALDFSNALEYLSGEVMALYRIRTRDTRDTRNVSALSTPGRGQNRGGGRGGRNPNQNRNGGRGRGGNRDRGGRGRGRGNNGQQQGTDRYSSSGILLNDGAYSNHVWFNVLSQEDRDYCESLRARRRERDRNRNINAMNTNSDQNGNNTGNTNANDSNSGRTGDTTNTNNGSGAGTGMSRRRNGS